MDSGGTLSKSQQEFKTHKCRRWFLEHFPLFCASCFNDCLCACVCVCVCLCMNICLSVLQHVYTKLYNIRVVPTCLSARSISIPWFQGAAGLARQSPALPRRLMSIFWRRRVRKASAITRTPSYVRDEVYWRTEENREREETELRKFTSTFRQVLTGKLIPLLCEYTAWQRLIPSYN